MNTGTIQPGDAIALTKALVAIDSRNPLLVPGGPGEAEVAALLHGVLASWGFRTEMFDAAPLRANVIARIGVQSSGKSLMFNGHLDVVGVEGMSHAPFEPRIANGRLYGRGSADMKGGIAAMCAGAWRAAQQGVQGEIIIAAVADEEFTSLGTKALIERGVRADAAVVTEPTNLSIMPAHRGFAFLEVDVRGRAAHGSRYDIGVDAILHAGLLLAELHSLELDILPQSSHPLLGRPSIHASFIEGGTGMSTYPDRCVLKLERRTIPGETPAQICEQIEAACTRVTLRVPQFEAKVRMLIDQGPSDVSVDSPVVKLLSGALKDSGELVSIEGMSAWTDAALLNEAGIPAICFGPGDISLAHAAEEYIPLDEIERATAVLARLALTWCN